MIKLKSLLKEAKEKEKPEFSEDAVFKFFDKNKKKLESLADDDNWDEFYELGYDQFADEDQDKVAQAMNKAAMRAGIFANEDVPEMPTEKDLELAAFGEKKDQGKGIKMGDYVKKMKSPKASSTELYIESKKKMKTP